MAALPYLLKMALSFPMVESTEPYAKRLGHEQDELVLCPKNGHVSQCTTVLPKLSFLIKKSTTSSGMAVHMSHCEVNPRKSINASSKALFLFLVWRRALPSNQTLFTRTYNGQIDRSFKVRRSLGNSLLTLITTPLTVAEISHWVWRKLDKTQTVETVWEQ